MSSKQFFNRDFSDFIFLVTLSIVSIILIGINIENPQYRYIRQSFLELTGSIGNQISNVESYLNLQSENNRLRSENEKIHKELTEHKHAYFELFELKRNLNIHLGDTLDYVYAEVVIQNKASGFQYIVLNKGNYDSVKINDPVIYRNVLVGRVYEVSKNFSTVQLVSDPGFEISVRLMRNSEIGTVIWSGQNSFRMNYISKNIDVQLGDLVVSSGLSNIYPKNIRIGIIDYINKDVSGLFQEIHLRSEINYNRLSYVTIIKRKHSNELEKILLEMHNE